jgi:hypothetical protein
LTKIKELEQKSEAQNKLFSILSTQLKKAQDDLRYDNASENRQTKRKKEISQKEKQQTIDSIDELHLYTENAVCFFLDKLV